MEIPDAWASLLVSAVRDAVLYNEQLLKSETIRDKDDYQEHLVYLSELLEFIKSEYKNLDIESKIPLDKLL